MGFATDAIHVGQEPDPPTGAIVAPIYQTSTYVQEEMGKNKGYDYARTNHPNRKALERTVAKLEGGQRRVRVHFGNGGHRFRFPAAASGRPRHHFPGGLRRSFPPDDAVAGAIGDWSSALWTLPVWRRWSGRSSPTPK